MLPLSWESWVSFLVGRCDAFKLGKGTVFTHSITCRQQKKIHTAFPQSNGTACPRMGPTGPAARCGTIWISVVPLSTFSCLLNPYKPKIPVEPKEINSLRKEASILRDRFHHPPPSRNCSINHQYQYEGAVKSPVNFLIHYAFSPE